MRDANKVDRERQQIERAEELAFQYLDGPADGPNSDMTPEGIAVTMEHTPLHMVRAGFGESRAVYLPIRDGQPGIVRVQQNGEPLWSVDLGGLIVELFATAYTTRVELSVVIRKEQPPVPVRIARAA